MSLIALIIFVCFGEHNFSLIKIIIYVKMQWILLFLFLNDLNIVYKFLSFGSWYSKYRGV